MVEGKTASVTFRGSRLRSRDLEGQLRRIRSRGPAACGRPASSEDDDDGSIAACGPRAARTARANALRDPSADRWELARLCDPYRATYDAIEARPARGPADDQRAAHDQAAHRRAVRVEALPALWDMIARTRTGRAPRGAPRRRQALPADGGSSRKYGRGPRRWPSGSCRRRRPPSRAANGRPRRRGRDPWSREG